MPPITRETLKKEQELLSQKLLQAQMEHFAVEGALAELERLLVEIDRPEEVLPVPLDRKVENESQTSEGS
jgi:hypothetical protein